MVFDSGTDRTLLFDMTSDTLPTGTDSVKIVTVPTPGTSNAARPEEPDRPCRSEGRGGGGRCPKNLARRRGRRGGRGVGRLKCFRNPFCTSARAAGRKV